MLHRSVQKSVWLRFPQDRTMSFSFARGTQNVVGGYALSPAPLPHTPPLKSPIPCNPPLLTGRPFASMAGQVAQADAKPAAKYSPALVPPHHQLVPHTQCLSSKLNMCNSSKFALLVHGSSIPFFWIPNDIGIASMTLPHIVLKFPCNPPPPPGGGVACQGGRFQTGGG